ncbi:MAG: TenA family transcriptional regulator [Bacillota bacterium]
MSLRQLIDKVLTETDYKNNPYFTNLHAGNFAKEDFLETQIQFYYAVVFFSRPMAALAAKIPSPELRLEVIRNVWEEHGEGNLSIAHGSTFIELLNRLGGVELNDVMHRGLWPEIRTFNTTLIGVSVLDDFIIGVATLGIIERMFSDISGWIGQGIVKNGWLTDDRMIHYKLHQALDIKHSDDFFQIIEKAYNTSDEYKYHIEQGLRLGACVFNDMYAGLWRSRKFRWIQETAYVPSRSADIII